MTNLKSMSINQSIQNNTNDKAGELNLFFFFVANITYTLAHTRLKKQQKKPAMCHYKQNHH